MELVKTAVIYEIDIDISDLCNLTAHGCMLYAITEIDGVGDYTYNLDRSVLIITVDYHLANQYTENLIRTKILKLMEE